MKKRIFSTILVLSMIFGMLPGNIFVSAKAAEVVSETYKFYGKTVDLDTPDSTYSNYNAMSAFGGNWAYLGSTGTGPSSVGSYVSSNVASYMQAVADAYGTWIAIKVKAPLDSADRPAVGAYSVDLTAYYHTQNASTIRVYAAPATDELLAALDSSYTITEGDTYYKYEEDTTLTTTKDDSKTLVASDVYKTRVYANETLYGKATVYPNTWNNKILYTGKRTEYDSSYGIVGDVFENASRTEAVSFSAVETPVSGSMSTYVGTNSMGYVELDGSDEYVLFMRMEGGGRVLYPRDLTLTKIGCRTPKANIPSGIYAGEQLVVLTADDGFDIYYTTDGSEPSVTNGKKYTGAIAISDDTTIKAIAADAESVSPISTYTYNFRIDKPAAQPAGGTFTQQQNVTLTTSVADGTIYYTLDGTDPETNGIKYNPGTTVPITKNVVLKAVTVKEGYITSAIASFEYTIKATPPSASVASGYYNEPQILDFYTTLGGKVYYTTDGSEPTIEKGILYSEPITIDKSVTIRAATFKDDCEPSVSVDFDYVIYDDDETYLCYNMNVAKETGKNKHIAVLDESSFNSAKESTGIASEMWYFDKSKSTNDIVYWYSDNHGIRATNEGFATESQYTSIVIDVPKAGTYDVAAIISKNAEDKTYGAIDTGFYLSPIGSSSWTDSANLLRKVDTLGIVPNTNLFKVYLGRKTLTAGKHVFTVDMPISHRYLWIREIVLATPYVEDPAATAPSISVSGKKVTISSTHSGAKIYYTTNGTAPTVNSKRYTGTFTLSENTVIRAVAIADGYSVSAPATAIAIAASSSRYSLDKTALSKVVITSGASVPCGDSVALYATGTLASGKQFSIPKDMLSYELVSESNSGVATVSKAGVVSGLAEGTVTVKATATYGGKSVTSANVTVTVGASSEIEPAITTLERREIIRENIANYSWANATANSTISAADKIVAQYDKIYNLVVGENLPRYYHIGHAYDPEKFTCRYCGANIQAKYGNYGFLTDPLNYRWKVKCPDCLRVFPSNDFEGFYKLGLDEHGIFQYDQAVAANNALIASGEKGYLVNLLYPEKGAGWGVDDGFGYKPGNTYSNGVEEKHSYIAYYLHEGLWHDGILLTSINTLADAYIYTGDIRYGSAGAIILDRIADVYPDFEWARWRSFRGDSYKGKVMDIVWNCSFASDLAYAYDAFLPAYGDAKVVEYLSEKARKYNLDNKKTTSGYIRQNAQDNLLRETYNDAVVSNLAGNFGMTQRAVANAAIALNTMPETGEWLEWLMLPGEPNTNPRTGGKIGYQLITNVDRDGNGNESAPGYNSLWPENLLETAELMADYEGYEGANLYENPKFAKMFSAQIPLVLGGNYIIQVGDSGAVGSIGNSSISKNTLIAGYRHLKDYRLAQMIYLLNGKSTANLRYPIYVKNPESLASEVEAVIKEHGELELASSMSPGYGFAALRAGEGYNYGAYKKPSVNRDFAIYFGRGTGHGHFDGLSLMMSAYGINMAPDLGYPEQTGSQPNRIQWVDAVTSHNTVMVNGKNQTALSPHGTPLHFDDSDRVKVMDVDATNAYPDIDMYRRTLVMVEVDEEVSYGVDFFRIDGGNDHLYSFHSMSNTIHETEGLSLVKQADSSGNYVGTYAGANVPWGEDPNTIVTSSVTDYLKYPVGFTWLYNVSRDSSPNRKFAVDFAIEDFRGVVVDENLHLRMTMVNPFDLTEFAIADANPPAKPGNPKTLKYVLARRSGSDLDSLYTTVFEPYKEERYIRSIDPVNVSVVSGSATGPVHAVKVTHVDGRVDYIVYANDNTVTYNVDNVFDFRGFVGVYSVKDGVVIYRYVNDGDIIGGTTGKTVAYTGTISDFTKALQLENSITVSMNQTVENPDSLVGKFIYVENDGVQNGAYEIKSVEVAADGKYVLDIGDVTLIRAYKNANNPELGYYYNISTGAKFRIPNATLVETTAAAAVKASVPSGEYNSVQKVELSCDTPNATIYYTLDGTEPKVGGKVYSRAIEVSEDTVIRAIAVADGYFNSEIATYDYVIDIPTTGVVATTGKSLILDGIIYINYYMQFRDFNVELTSNDIIKNGGLMVWKQGNTPDEFVAGTESYRVTGLAKAAYQYQGYDEYTIYTEGITAKEYGDVFTFRPYIVIDGEYFYGDPVEYSVREYCTNQLGKASAKQTLKDVCQAMLNYGAAAQLQQKHNTDKLANSGLTAEQKELLWDDSYITPVVEADSFTAALFESTGDVNFTAKSLSLDGAITVALYNNAASTYGKEVTKTMYFWTKEDYDAIVDAERTLGKKNASYTIEVSDATNEGYGYEYKTFSDGIPAKAYSDTLYIALVVEDENGKSHSSGVLAYNPEVYASNQIKKASAPTTLKNLVKWMVIYGEKAAAHFGA